VSNTIVDMPKVTQMLDAGWRVIVYRNGMGSYSAEANHRNPEANERARQRLVESMRQNKQFLAESGMTAEEAVAEMDYSEDGDYLMTDDFTPEQALSRLAYKVHGEIL
jgi:hypothetical protein